jgi:hypothetical protein
MSGKLPYIEAYFQRWQDDLVRAGELLHIPRFYLEAWLVLSCYIGAFGAMRFHSMRDGESYVKIIFDYSGKRTFYEQLDLLFLYQWPRSKLRDHGTYKSFTQHADVVAALQRIYGSENELKPETRYVDQSAALSQVLVARMPVLDEGNVRRSLPLFSLAEQLYRFVRCDAVHNAEFPFINKVYLSDGNIRYQDNHAITGAVLFDTASGILQNLSHECAAKEKWPHEL